MCDGVYLPHSQDQIQLAALGWRRRVLRRFRNPGLVGRHFQLGFKRIRPIANFWRHTVLTRVLPLCSEQHRSRDNGEEVGFEGVFGDDRVFWGAD